MFKIQYETHLFRVEVTYQSGETDTIWAKWEDLEQLQKEITRAIKEARGDT